jgi:hypothetical protein
MSTNPAIMPWMGREKKQNQPTSSTNSLLNRNPVETQSITSVNWNQGAVHPIRLELKTAVIPNFVDGNRFGKLF